MGFLSDIGKSVGDFLGSGAGGILPSLFGESPAEKAAKQARRDAQQARVDARLQEQNRSRIANIQAQAELRRMAGGLTRIQEAPRDTSPDIGVGEVQAGLTLGESTGYLVPVAK